MHYVTYCIIQRLIGGNRMEIGNLFLYGMIGQVKKNGKVEKCLPVFRNKAEQCYTVTRHDTEEKMKCTPIDISVYGQPLFLPASRKKIDDGKEYFFIFQSKKSQQIFNFGVAAHPEIRVGIYNNEEFCVLRCRKWQEPTNGEMTFAYKQQNGRCFW
jgi:hypothetical protein